MLAAMLVGTAQVGVSMAVASLVAVEILNAAAIPVLMTPMLSAIRITATVSVVTIEAIVDVSPEVLVTVIPRTGADEHPTREPFRPIVAVRRAFIRWVIEIAVRADGRRADLNSDLRICLRSRNREAEGSYSEYKNELKLFHESSWDLAERTSHSTR